MKRWISIYVENKIGVLAKISGLFAGKAYNLQSLTVGITEDPTISRMTIGLTSDDNTFEQIKKQLNRCVEVIKVVDLTNMRFYAKELMYIRLENCSEEETTEVFRIAEVLGICVVDYGPGRILLECLHQEEKNNDIINLMKERFQTIHVVRGGSVAIESR